MKLQIHCHIHHTFILHYKQILQTASVKTRKCKSKTKKQREKEKEKQQNCPQQLQQQNQPQPHPQQQKQQSQHQQQQQKLNFNHQPIVLSPHTSHQLAMILNLQLQLHPVIPFLPSQHTSPKIDSPPILNNSFEDNTTENAEPPEEDTDAHIQPPVTVREPSEEDADKDAGIELSFLSSVPPSYRHPDLTKRDVLALLHHYKGLTPKPVLAFVKPTCR